MRINPDFPIQQPRGANVQKNTAEHVGDAEHKDVLAIEARDVDIRSADRGARESQDAMTLFRIADGALAKMEDAIARMGEVADKAGMSADDAELGNMQFEADDLAELARFAGENATMGGVPLFGGSADTAAMWNATLQNVNALSPSDDNAGIAGISDMGLEALGLDGLDIRAPEAPARIEAAIGRVSAARDTMTTQAERMGDVARDMTVRALERFSVGPRITDSNTAAGLMRFVRESIAASPDAAVSTQARQNSFDVAKINA